MRPLEGIIRVCSATDWRWMARTEKHSTSVCTVETGMCARRDASGAEVGQALVAVDAQPDGEREEARAAHQRQHRQHDGHHRQHREPPCRALRRACAPSECSWALAAIRTRTLVHCTRVRNARTCSHRRGRRVVHCEQRTAALDSESTCNYTRTCTRTGSTSIQKAVESFRGALSQAMLLVA